MNCQGLPKCVTGDFDSDRCTGFADSFCAREGSRFARPSHDGDPYSVAVSTGFLACKETFRNLAVRGTVARLQIFVNSHFFSAV